MYRPFTIGGSKEWDGFWYFVNALGIEASEKNFLFNPKPTDFAFQSIDVKKNRFEMFSESLWHYKAPIENWFPYMVHLCILTLCISVFRTKLKIFDIANTVSPNITFSFFLSFRGTSIYSTIPPALFMFTWYDFSFFLSLNIILLDSWYFWNWFWQTLYCCLKFRLFLPLNRFPVRQKTKTKKFLFTN